MITSCDLDDFLGTEDLLPPAMTIKNEYGSDVAGEAGRRRLAGGSVPRHLSGGNLGDKEPRHRHPGWVAPEAGQGCLFLQGAVVRRAPAAPAGNWSPPAFGALCSARNVYVWWGRR
jgi:hypothetical protein